MTNKSEEELVDVVNMTLDNWLALVREPRRGKLFPSWCFPTARHREEYLVSINSRSQEEVLFLLSEFLIPSGGLGCDLRNAEYLGHIKIHEPENFVNAMKRQYNRRLVRSLRDRRTHPWEGITWVLDLLPDDPKRALQVLDAYVGAHALYLPDGRITGMDDAEALIRAKFIGAPRSPEEALGFLFDLSPRDFEHLVEALYDAMAYATMLTPAQKDGGRDVVARRDAPGCSEFVLVECKLHNATIPVETMRSLLGVVSYEKANKGVLVTSSSFTRDALRMVALEPRLETVDGGQLVVLLNEHLGSRWPLFLDSHIRESRKRGQTANTTPADAA